MVNFGIVYGLSSTVAVAALISDTTDEAGAATGIARVALAAYSYFEDQAENPNRPTVPRAPTRAIPPTWREPRPVPTATAVVEEEIIEPTPEPTVAPAATVAPTVMPTPAPLSVAPALKPTAAPPPPTATLAPPPPTATAVPAQPTRVPTARPATPLPTVPSKR